MRRKKTVKPMRYRSVGIATFFVLAGIAAIAVLAAEWRQNVVGVELDVNGLAITSSGQIRKAAGLTDSSSLARLDLHEIRHAILGNPFVKDVDVSRDPPRTLKVQVVERTPIALLLNVQTKDWLIDEDGFVLPAQESASLHDLPVLTEVENIRELKPGVRIVNARIRNALRVLKAAQALNPDYLHLFSEVNLSQRKDLVFYTLEGGVPVIFGSAREIPEKLRSFAAFWENVVMKYDPSSLEYIDVRWKEQVVARWRRTSDAPVAELPMAEVPAETDSTENVN